MPEEIMGKENSDGCRSFLGSVRNSSRCRDSPVSKRKLWVLNAERLSSHFPLAEQKQMQLDGHVRLDFIPPHIGHWIGWGFLKLCRDTGLFWAFATADTMTRRFFLIQHKHEHMVWLWTWCLTLPLLSCSKNIYHFIFIFLSTCMGHILIRSRKKGDRLKFKLWQFYDVDILCKKRKVSFILIELL